MTATFDVPVLVKVTMHVSVVAVQNITCAVTVAELVDDSDVAVTVETVVAVETMVTVETVVAVETIVTVETVVTAEVEVYSSVLVSVVVFGESECVAKRVMKIRPAPTKIPIMLRTAPVVWLDALLRMDGMLQADYSKHQGEGHETV
jgi:hypothetical protein